MRGGERQAADQHLGAAQGRSEAFLAEAVAELERLDSAALRRRWRSLYGSSLPPDLGRALAVRVLAYKLQAQHLGDLDKGSLRELAALVSRRASKTPADKDAKVLSQSNKDGGTGPIATTTSAQAKPHPLARPGTVLVREHAGVRHRVMVLDEGIAWNGKTFASLSQVALAITGTRWNGPRFFGLRDQAAKDQRSLSRPPGHSGQGKRSHQRAPSSRQAVSLAQDHP